MRSCVCTARAASRPTVAHRRPRGLVSRLGHEPSPLKPHNKNTRQKNRDIRTPHTLKSAAAFSSTGSIHPSLHPSSVQQNVHRAGGARPASRSLLSLVSLSHSLSLLRFARCARVARHPSSAPRVCCLAEPHSRSVFFLSVRCPLFFFCALSHGYCLFLCIRL